MSIVVYHMFLQGLKINNSIFSVRLNNPAFEDFDLLSKIINVLIKQEIETVRIYIYFIQF